jgi:hypothetical protein
MFLTRCAHSGIPEEDLGAPGLGLKLFQHMKINLPKEIN